jgi:hypothetical protein
MNDNLETERVTLAVLRNDLIHLTGVAQLLRGDFQKACNDWVAWRSEMEKSAREATADRAQLRAEVTVIKWAFGIITAVVLALVVTSIKSALGI